MSLLTTTATLEGADTAGADPVFDVPALAATPLNPRILKKTSSSGIVTEEIRFHSEMDGDKDVDIFAYFSYPEGAKQLPAYIWNPGGLGQASTGFTIPGAKRGYAVLCIDFPQKGYRSTGGYLINTGLDLGDDPRQAPIYHGAVALIKAVSYLETRPEVDKNRIGMAGSSWGGFFTTLMIGVDHRLKVGSCLYGTGSLQLGNAWWDGASRRGNHVFSPAEREHWRTTLDPAGRLEHTTTPIAWFTGTNDLFYPMPALMQTYALAGGKKHLTLVPNWHHALPVEINDELFYAWLDVHLKGRKVFSNLTPVSAANEDGHLIARWKILGAGDLPTDSAASADAIVSYQEAGNWAGRCWLTFPAKIKGRECSVEIPACILPAYISGSVVDTKGFRSSTPLLRADAGALGIKATKLVPDYDGCAEWGSFEDAQMAYLIRHDRSGQKRWIPRRSRDAKDGTYSAILEPGRTILPPILSTATVPHRFTCYLKADSPTTVTVQLGNTPKKFAVGTEWKQIALVYTLPNSLMGGITAAMSVPPGAKVLVDAISFRPQTPETANPKHE